MSDTLRDQLLKAGFAKSQANQPRGADRREHRKPETKRGGNPAHAPKRNREELDLARAYAIRAQADKAERERAERDAQRQAQERRERKRRLQELLAGNLEIIAADAEHVRHFEHAGKIRRVHVSAEQMARLNKGELGVVVQAGRFVLVTREVALKAGEIAPDGIALLVDPDAPAEGADDGVPDDLMW